MVNQIIAGALMCVALPSAAQFNAELSDSIAGSVELQEIEIKASPRIIRADRNIILPTRSIVEASSNGRDLISRLDIARIIVNPLTGEIGMTGNGKVAITINGVLSSSSELASIPAEDIIRVEHMDNPGPRYPDANILLNIVTRRHNSGMNISADLLNAFKNGGEADIDNLSLTFSHGKSQWSYTGQLMRIKRNNWARDYSETRISPDGTVEITETGKPSEMEISAIENYLTYSLADGNRYLFNAKFGFLVNDVPHSEEADRTTIRTSSLNDAVTEIHEHMGESSCAPSLDLYGQLRLNNGTNLIGNIVGTYINSTNNNLYRQTDQSGDIIENIASDIKGHKYSIISEFACNRQLDIHKINGGIRHFQSYADNKYSGDVVSKIAIRQAQTTIYGQYSVAIDRINIVASLGASRFYNSQDGASKTSYIFTPSMAVSWMPADGLSLRYRASLQGKMPSLSELSDVGQMIDPDYIRRGNPKLKTFRILDHEISAGWEWRWLSFGISLPMTHEFKPVMESVTFENNTFIRTYFNQKSFTHIGAEATVTVRPWNDFFTLSVTPTIDHYRTHGNDFNCTNTIRNLRIDAEINWKKWQLSYNTLTGYANYMYGSRLMRERNMSMITAGYKTERYTLKIGVLDPFIRKYWMETRDSAPLLSSVSHAYSNRPTYFVMQVGVNLNFGRNTIRHDIGLENSDTDNGLLKGVK